MKEKERFVTFVAKGDEAITEVRDLVCGLCTLGAKLLPEMGVVRLLETKPDGAVYRVEKYVLADKLATGEDVRSLVKQWRSPEWLAANPQTPLAWVRQAVVNTSAFRASLAKVSPLAVVRRGRRKALIPVDATEERKKELLERLEKPASV